MQAPTSSVQDPHAVPIFNGTNHVDWCNAIRLSLGVRGYLPALDPNDKTLNYLEKTAALKLIMSSLDRPYQRRYAECPTAAHIWKDINTLFEDQRRIGRAKHNLRKLQDDRKKLCHALGEADSSVFPNLDELGSFISMASTSRNFMSVEVFRSALRASLRHDLKSQDIQALMDAAKDHLGVLESAIKAYASELEERMKSTPSVSEQPARPDATAPPSPVALPAPKVRPSPPSPLARPAPPLAQPSPLTPPKLLAPAAASKLASPQPSPRRINPASKVLGIELEGQKETPAAAVVSSASKSFVIELKPSKIFVPALVKSNSDTVLASQGSNEESNRRVSEDSSPTEPEIIREVPAKRCKAEGSPASNEVSPVADSRHSSSRTSELRVPSRERSQSRLSRRSHDEDEVWKSHRTDRPSRDHSSPEISQSLSRANLGRSSTSLVNQDPTEAKNTYWCEDKQRYSVVFYLDVESKYHVTRDRGYLLNYRPFDSKKEIKVEFNNGPSLYASGEGIIIDEKTGFCLENVLYVEGEGPNLFASRAAIRAGFREGSGNVFKSRNNKRLVGRKNKYTVTFKLFARPARNRINT